MIQISVIVHTMGQAVRHRVVERPHLLLCRLFKELEKVRATVRGHVTTRSRCDSCSTKTYGLAGSACWIADWKNNCASPVEWATEQGRIQELGAGGGTGEGVAGGGAKLDAEPPRGGCGRGAPLPPS